MNDRIVSAFDHCIAELREIRRQQIEEITAARAGSSLFKPEDAVNDPEVQETTDAINGLQLLCKKFEDHAQLKKDAK